MVKAIKLILKENTIFDLFFYDGIVKRYDILSLSDKFPQLSDLRDRKLFLKGHLLGWGGVVWNDELDVSSETVYDEGKDVTNEYDDTDILNIVIGYQIKEKRLQKEMSQEELAKKVQEKVSLIKDLESGTGVYYPKIVEKIEKALNVKFERSWKK